MNTIFNEFVTEFAQGDFSSWANSFAQAGFLVQQPYAGVMQIRAAESDPERIKLVISVGVHGDETAPIEMMSLLLEALSKAPHLLAVDLMVVIGNLPAIAQGKRFIDVDLNRLFTSDRTAFGDAQEVLRADQLMQVLAQFFNGRGRTYHLDLHSAIRPSVYSTFAIVPGRNNPEFINWLGAAGIEAIVLSPQPSVTFSSFTCGHLGAVSCTAELGRIGRLGNNDLSQFVMTRNAIADLLRTGIVNLKNKAAPSMFRVKQELVKRSEAFQFTFGKDTQNFTAFSPNTILASDGDITWTVGPTPEYVLFPNPDVHIGLRACLMVERLIT